jgi:hypothetical protein
MTDWVVEGLASVEDTLEGVADRTSTCGDCGLAYLNCECCIICGEPDHDEDTCPY